jgi:signal peptidase II
MMALTAAALTVLTASLARLWSERSLDPGETIPLSGNFFRLTRGENPGVAFGLLEGFPLVPWLAALALVALALCLARPLLGSRAGGVALGLVLGGGLANVLDRLGDGSVTDYLDVGVRAWRWPTFNVPDAAITVGLLLAVWLLARGVAAAEDTPPQPAADRSTAARGRGPASRGEEDAP